MNFQTEQNTRTMEARALSAAAQVLNLRAAELSAIFEHGQWWIEHLPTGAQWSVVDAQGGRSIDGFDFEQVTEGEAR